MPRGTPQDQDRSMINGQWGRAVGHLVTRNRQAQSLKLRKDWRANLHLCYQIGGVANGARN